MRHSYKAFIISAIVAFTSQKAAAVDFMLTIPPTLPDTYGNNLGSSVISDPSEYFETITNRWAYPAIYPQYAGESKDVINAGDLVPDRIIILPDGLTIRTSQRLGPELDENRYKKIGQINGNVITQVSANSVFVYAFNKKGDLIYPLAKNPSGSGYVNVYETLLFGNHVIRPDNTIPIVASPEVDGNTDGYDPSKPKSNPPWSFMFRARTAGNYQFQVAVRINKILLPANIPDRENILKSVKYGSFSVTAVDGPEIIDALILTGQSSTKCDSLPACVVIKSGETIDISATGLIFKQSWSDSTKQYEFSYRRQISIQKLTWRYDESAPANPEKLLGCFYLKPLEADGSRVSIVARNLLPKDMPCSGRVIIDGHGRMFELRVNINGS